MPGAFAPGIGKVTGSYFLRRQLKPPVSDPSPSRPSSGRGEAVCGSFCWAFSSMSLNCLTPWFEFCSAPVLAAFWLVVLPEAALPDEVCAVDCSVCPLPTVFAGVWLLTGGVVVLVVLVLCPLTAALLSVVAGAAVLA